MTAKSPVHLPMAGGDAREGAPPASAAFLASSQEICARMALEAPADPSAEWMYMPGGTHEIRALHGAGSVQAQIKVDQRSAQALQEQLSALMARSAHRPYFDFNHDDQAASFWPEAFAWRDAPRPGVYVRGEWSDDGAAAIRGKRFRSFSPTFHVDNPAARPAQVVCNPNARLNMGGLVNAPAFWENPPFWAKDDLAGAAGSDTNNKSPETAGKDDGMTESELAALKAKVSELNQQVTELQGKASTDLEKAELRAKQAEAKAATETLRAAEAQARAEKAEGEIKARNTTMAKAAVQAAIGRGAIPAQNAELQARYQGLIEADPANVVLLEALPGAAALSAGPITGGQRIMAKEGPARIAKAYGELAAKSGRIRDLTADGLRQKGALALEMAAIFAKEIRGNSDFLDMPISAATSADDLGTLNGTLVVQQALDLFEYTYPMIGAVYMDFSAQPARLGQTITTRIISAPAVQTYDKTLNTDGRPKGWTTVSSAVTTDVSIATDEHIGVPIVFDSDTLGGTNRRLFDEMAPAASYSLAKYFVAKLYALITPARFNAYATVVANKVPKAYPTYAVGLDDFSRTHLTRIGAILNKNEVPALNRSILLDSDYYAQLGTDPILSTFYASQRAPEIITDGTLPVMSRFKPIEAPDFPAAVNGLAMQKSALVALARVPLDYTQALPGASYGSVTTVTNPKISLSMMLVQYVNHTGGYAEWRIEAVIGAAVGDKRAGLILTGNK